MYCQENNNEMTMSFYVILYEDDNACHFCVILCVDENVIEHSNLGLKN
jgi:Pyruvate/2-oxoacid:ferredoxin oxidoreductase delta subunit